jgi:hypothetical protein
MAIISNDPITNEYGITLSNCYIRLGKKLIITLPGWSDGTSIYSIEIAVETFVNKDARLNHQQPFLTDNIVFSLDKLGDNVYETIYTEVKKSYPNYTDDL